MEPNFKSLDQIFSYRRNQHRLKQLNNDTNSIVNIRNHRMGVDTRNLHLQQVVNR